jgi:hypothetical protein
MLSMRSVAELHPTRVRLGRAGARMLPLGMEPPARGIQRDDSLLCATDETRRRGMGPRSDKGDGDPNQDPDPPVVVMPSDPGD